MENSLNKVTEAPLGVATSAPLPKNCIYCCHFSCAFEVPFCLIFECEIGNTNHICEYYDINKPTDDLPF